MDSEVEVQDGAMPEAGLGLRYDTLMQNHPFDGPDGGDCDKCGKHEGEHPVVELDGPPPDPTTGLPPPDNDE